jgi:D-alanine-D-alanine ligase
MKVGIVLDNTEPTWAEPGVEHEEQTTYRGRTVHNKSVFEVAEGIADGLRAYDYEPVILPLPADVRGITDTIARADVDVLFNLMETVGGESSCEPYVVGIFELMEIPYTGATAETLTLCMNKGIAKGILDAHGIPVTESVVIEMENWDWDSDLPWPVFVKPAAEDASWGLSADSICHTEKQLRKQVSLLLSEYCDSVLIEPFIDGREFNVTLIGNPPQVFPLSEISFEGLPEGLPNIVTYDGKWDPEHPAYTGTVPIVPAPVSPSLARRLREVATDAYITMDCRDYARVDIRTDADENIYVLEVNPNPDLSRDAGVANSARVHGWDYPMLIASIAEFAYERHWYR